MIAKYKRLKVDDPIGVKLYDFDENEKCMADILVYNSGDEVRGLKVAKGLGNGVLVYMPGWMSNKWSCAEVAWDVVCQAVSEHYKQTPHKKVEPEFRFYSHYCRLETTATVTDFETGTTVEAIYVSYIAQSDKGVRVNMPKGMDGEWKAEAFSWEEVVAAVDVEFRRQLLNEDVEPEDMGFAVSFSPLVEVSGCAVDVVLPHKKNPIKGFKLYRKGDEPIKLFTPAWMGDKWSDKRYPWHVLRKLIGDAYLKTIDGSQNEPEQEPEAEQVVLPAGQEVSESCCAGQTDGCEEAVVRVEAAKKVPKSQLGIVLNAERNPFRFFPRTVLRRVELKKKKNNSTNPKAVKKNPIHQLVFAMNKGSLGGIGPFEINLLMWIEKLRYVTSAMLLKLIENGYVSYGWRTGMSADKLTDALNRMHSYDLVEITRFVTVDDEGNPDNTGESIARIYTIGKTGNTLLRELGKNTVGYNAFDILQDGNTVKRQLSANQWLVYLLSDYKEHLNEHYEPTCVIYQKGSDYIGARFLATVVLNDIPLVAESIRRCETFEVNAMKSSVREKAGRMLKMFENLDQLYKGRDRIEFPRRPILVMICEDEAHITEIVELLSDSVGDNSEQTIWFTTDLRVFNQDQRDCRFLYVNNGELCPVNEKQFFGME